MYALNWPIWPLFYFSFQGMDHLQDRGIVHRDLAARNVLGKIGGFSDFYTFHKTCQTAEI